MSHVMILWQNTGELLISLASKYEYCLFAIVNCNVNQHLDFCMPHNTTDIDIFLEYLASLHYKVSFFLVVNHSF